MFCEQLRGEAIVLFTVTKGLYSLDKGAKPYISIQFYILLYGVLMAKMERAEFAFVKKCDVCGKEISGFTERQVETNLNAHKFSQHRQEVQA